MKVSKINGSNIAGGNPRRGRAKNDYYATNPKDTLDFIEQLSTDGFSLDNKTILEPCAGAGHITDVLLEKYKDITVDQFDIAPKRDDVQELDFLKGEFGKYDVVLTNPPFKIAKDIITKSLDIADEYVIMFLKLQFLESVSRKEWLKNSPLKYIYVYSRRASPMMNGSNIDENGKKFSNTMTFAWFVWEQEYEGEPIVRWI